jgi:molybdopterin/thiamine biosynthesis adenylyltransferase
LGRHVLGYSDLEQPKAIALAEHLGQFHPDVQIAPFHRNAVQDWSSIERSDLIIDATGDYNVATALNELRMNSKRSGDELAILHTWVFGNGIAAQSFLNLNDGLACYHCLKPIFGGSWRQSPAKDVKAPQQIAPANCGEAGYVPFSADAPTVAAALTLRAVLDWAEHQPGQRLRTVTLNHAEGNDVKWTSPKRSNSCGACNG